MGATQTTCLRQANYKSRAICVCHSLHSIVIVFQLVRPRYATQWPPPDVAQRAVYYAALIPSEPVRTSSARCRCPCRSIGSIVIGISGPSRLPQIQLDASPITINASRVAPM